MRDTMRQCRRRIIHRDQKYERLLEAVSAGGGDVPAELIGGDVRLNLRLNEQRPPVIIKYTSIRKAATFFLVSGNDLARDLLLRYAKVAIGRDVMNPGPVEKRSELGTVSIERAHQRVGEPVLWLGVLVKEVAHESRLSRNEAIP